MLKRYIAALDSGVSGTPNTYFTADSAITDSATQDTHTANLVGVALATLTIQVTTYVNNNSNGKVQVNGNDVFLNSTFPVVLNGAGLGSFQAHVEGNAGNSNTVVRAVFTIVGMTAGNPGSPISNGISKVF